MGDAKCPDSLCLKGCVGGYEKIGDSMVDYLQAPIYWTGDGDGSAEKCAEACDNAEIGGQQCKGFSFQKDTAQCHMFYVEDPKLATPATSGMDQSMLDKYKTFVKCKSATTTTTDPKCPE